MAGTKRKSKRTTSSAAAAEHDETASQDAQDESQPRAIAIPDDLPLDTLSALLPDVSFDSPTPDAILSLYRLVAAQVVDLEAASNDASEARAEVLRKEVELETAIQDREVAIRDLETSLEAVNAELQAAKLERDALQNSQTTLQSQVSSLSSTQTASSSELDSLRGRVEDAESEKRSLMGVMDRMKEQDKLRDDEVKTMRDRLKEAREEITGLQSKLSETTASDSANKFKIHTIEQELILANSEREQLRGDLSSSIEERAKYRREKDTQIRELQAALDTATTAAESTRTTLEALQTTHANQERTLTQALSEVGELKGELAAKDAAFRAELANTKRMVTMLERRQEEARARVEEVDREWNELTATAAQTENRLRLEVERERARGDDLEKQLDELRVVMDKMNSGELPLPENGHAGNGFTLSPTAALASKLQKSGRSYTEVYTDYVRLQDELAKQKHETKRLEDCLAQILADIEERAPLLQEQRLEYDRVSTEARQLSEQLSAALQERDASVQRARAAEQRTTTLQREKEIIQMQTTDLGRQVQALLREQSLRENPNLALAELDQPEQGATDTDSLISAQLVIFRSIPELQQQNERLLGITRDLGARMERQEAEYRARDQEEDSALLREAEALVEEANRELEDTRKSAKIKLEAYAREVEMLKSLAAKSGTARALTASGVSNGGSELVPAGNGELQTLYQETQRAFDTYKIEIGEDNRRLKEDLMVSQREVGTANASLAKANAKITTLEERIRLAMDEKQTHIRAIAELTKAKESLQFNLTRVENSYSEVVEKHTVASGQIDAQRNQIVQLKTEREMLKEVESRLTAENKSLASQRTHLTDLMQNLRKMQADLERAEENDKRRLEGRAQNLEAQVEELRGQLNKERDLLRHAQFQKDSELRTLRERLDKAVQELGSTREQLVAAQTSQTHLQERVDDLSKHLQVSQERLSVYERRPSSSNAGDSSSDLSREQQLESEVAELRGLLKIAEVDLATARENVEQFRGISSASEAALEGLSNTYEQFKTHSEKELSDKSAAVADLERRLAELQQELTASSSRTAELQATLEKERAAFADDKRTLEDTIVDITNSNSMSSTDREAHALEIRQQQERAQRAEEQYQREIVAHAEAIKTLERTREQLLQAQASAREHQTHAETAQAKLVTSEASWSTQRDILDKQISELTTKQQALNEQNELLHKHLETVSSQAARIRQAADSSLEENAVSGSDPALPELRSIVSYLRKEKEIADLQLEINQQEIARLKADSERTMRELGEQKALLAEERARATNSLASAQQQAELVERINQLNILRESNATLRSDSVSLRKRVTQLEGQVQSLTSELEPVKAEARDAKAELESRLQQIAQLERENSKWKERNQQILQKYDRADPDELQRLKDELEAVRAEKQVVETERSELETKANTYRTNLSAYKDRYDSLTQQTRQNFTNLNAQISTHKEQVKALESERDSLQKALSEASVNAAATPVSTLEIDNLKARIQTVLAEKARLEESFAAEKKLLESRLASQQVATDSGETLALRTERDALLAEKASWTASNVEGSTASSSAQITELQNAQEQLKASLAKAQEDARKMLTQNRELASRIKDLHGKLETLNGEKAKLEGQLALAPDSSVDPSAELIALRAKVVDLEEHKAESVVQASNIPNQEAIDAAVAAAEAKFKAEHHAALQSAAENAKAELGMKLQLQETKLKSQETKFTRLNARVKQLTDLIVEMGGTLPDPPNLAAPTPAATAAASSSSMAPPTTPVTPKAGVVPGSQNAVAATALPGRKLSLPAIPAGAGLPATPVAASTAPSQAAPIPPAARGRGTTRGRGRGGLARGAAPNAAAALAAATSAASSAPAGAAPVGGAKRPREDGEQVAESLSKRLRAGGPVALQRNRPLPES